MNIFSKYIVLNVLRGILLVALIMVSLFAIILLIDELDLVGRRGYTLITALRYVFFNIPKLLLDFSAFICLVGSIIAMGSMASHQELIGLESLSFSPKQVVISVLMAAFALMLLVLLNAQYLIPSSLHKATVEKTLALEGRGGFVSSAGYWAQSNNRFIHVRDIENGRVPVNVEIYEFNQSYQLQRYIFSERVNLLNKDLWQLQNVKIKEILNGRLVTRTAGTLLWDSFLNTSQLGIIVSKPEALSISNLYRYINDLKLRNEQSYRYELLFWQKIMVPISAIIMILLGLPFVFGSQRTSSSGKRIAFGVLAGITYYVFTQVVTHFGASNQWMPFLIASLPNIAAVFVLVAIYKFQPINL